MAEKPTTTATPKPQKAKEAPKAASAEKTPAEASKGKKAVTIPKVTDALSTLATRVNGSKTGKDLITKAGLTGWDMQQVPMVAMPTTGHCSECQKPVGERHAADCQIALIDPDESGIRTVVEDDTSIPVAVPGVWQLLYRHDSTGAEWIPLGTPITRQNRKFVTIEQRITVLSDMVKATGKPGRWHAAGLLDGPGEQFASFRMPDAIKVGGVDEVELRIVLVNSLVAGQPSRVLFMPVRTAVPTTQRAILHAPNGFTLRADGADGPTEASEALTAATAYFAEFEHMTTAMLQAEFTTGEFETLFDHLWKQPSNDKLKTDWYRKRGLLTGLFEGNHKAFAPIKNTRWAAWQAVQVWTEHLTAVGSVLENPVEQAALSALFGEGKNVSEKAWKTLTA
ncbi:DUF945 domain-containing protein [Allokutzneria sp. A3M-2-11 16]|uniref:DUF932 domain-containing protein n=1 Tax=Allokutzneria sp. A3M-2-11 16 TaxID=2962043 RepID=UPI0020B68346|nr:DUF932 domain-containing protein [Allokutzneria sp. A3M-2-11 16]MCP3800338.1 DUF945 domain-containing protein [Allokutzneria sp. A3M-2-11 16]